MNTDTPMRMISMHIYTMALNMPSIKYHQIYLGYDIYSPGVFCTPSTLTVWSHNKHCTYRYILTLPELKVWHGSKKVRGNLFSWWDIDTVQMGTGRKQKRHICLQNKMQYNGRLYLTKKVLKTLTLLDWTRAQFRWVQDGVIYQKRYMYMSCYE